MARMPDLEIFARDHGLKIGAITDLIHYRSRTERIVERIAERPLTTTHGSFRLVVYRDKISDATHLALVRGPIAPDTETLVRVHEPLSVMDLLDADSASHSWTIPTRWPRWRRRAAAWSCCCTGPRARKNCAIAP
jgi:3,4-dihydroxy 2-butanone 4-phosphate synthase/GTP cyclohydrolase II